MEEIVRICKGKGIIVDEAQIIASAYIEAIRERYGAAEAPTEDLLVQDYPLFYLILKEAYQCRKNAADSSFHLTSDWKTWRNELNQLKLHDSLYKELSTVLPLSIGAAQTIGRMSNRFSAVYQLIPSLITFLSFNNATAAAIVLSSGFELKGLSDTFKTKEATLFLSQWPTTWMAAHSLLHCACEISIDDLLTNGRDLMALVTAYTQGIDPQPIMSRLLDKIEDLPTWLNNIATPREVTIVFPILTPSEENVRQSSLETWVAFRRAIDRYEDRRSETTKTTCGKLDVWALVQNELDVLSERERERDRELYGQLLTNQSTVRYNDLFKTFLNNYPVLVELLTIKGSKELEKMNAALGIGDYAFFKSEWGYIVTAAAAIKFAKQNAAGLAGINFTYDSKTKPHLNYPFFLLRSYTTPLNNDIIDNILTMAGKDGLVAIVDSLKYWSRSELSIEIVDLYVNYLEYQKDLTLVLELIKQTAWNYDLLRTLYYLVRQLMDLYSTFTTINELLHSLKMFIGALGDPTQMDNNPCTVSDIELIVFDIIVDYGTPLARRVADRFINPKIVIPLDSLRKCIDNHNLYKFMLYMKMDRSKIDVIDLYQIAFDYSPTILAYLLSRTDINMTRLPVLPTSITPTHLSSIHILLTHPNTPTFIRENPVLLERRYG